MPDVDSFARMSASLRRWLSEGEIVSPSGAYYAWFDADTCNPAFEYPEITGYALTHLASQPDPTDAERRSAANAAHWLVERWRGGDRSARAGWDDGRVYYFDLAMEANGLLLAGSRFGINSAVDVGAEIVRVMVAEIAKTGYLPCLPEADGGARAGWSTQGVPHMGKALQSLLHARELLEDASSDLDEAIKRVVQQTLDNQQADGRFVTDPSDEMTMLHPHLYAVEGLWCHAEATGDRASGAAAKAGATWVWDHQLSTGGLPRCVRLDGVTEGVPEQHDLTAQAVRAAYLTETSVDQAARAADRLVDVATPRANAAALIYQPEAGQRHLNAWVSLFGAQALGIAASLPIAWQELV
jgi:hypothetical protein